MFAFFAELLHCTKAYGPLSIDRWHSGRFGQSMLLKIETCTVLSKKISKLPSHFLKKNPTQIGNSADSGDHLM